MRERFDKTRDEKDMRKLAAMVEEGEEELFRNQHFQPFVWKVINRDAQQQIIVKSANAPYWETRLTARKAVSNLLFTFIVQNDPGGILYQRYHLANDNLLDIWHPWEKVLYKNYFDTREQRKEEAQAYYDSSFPKKGIKDLDTSEYPIKGPNV